MDIVYFIMQQTMFFAIPLLIVAIGGMYSERSGVINIALEGIMVIGAFAGVLFINMTQANLSGQGLLLIAIVIAGVTGGIFSLLHAFASINMKADQTISGTALNMFAPAFAIFAARTIQEVQQIQFTDTFQIDKVPVLGDIPVIGPLFFQNCYITTYIGILIFLVAAFVIKKTRFGLRLRACGEQQTLWVLMFIKSDIPVLLFPVFLPELAVWSLLYRLPQTLMQALQDTDFWHWQY